MCPRRRISQALQAKVEKLEAAQALQTAQVQQQATQVQQQAAKVEQQAVQVQQQAQAVEKVQQTAAAATSSFQSTWAASTTVSAYGEIGYTRPTKSTKDTNTDVQRAVIGMRQPQQHRRDIGAGQQIGQACRQRRRIVHLRRCEIEARGRARRNRFAGQNLCRLLL